MKTMLEKISLNRVEFAVNSIHGIVFSEYDHPNDVEMTQIFVKCYWKAFV